MIVMGLNQGMQPIAGYNYGAKLYPRVTRVLKLTIYGATIVTTTGFLMGMFIPDLAVSVFTSHEEPDSPICRRSPHCGTLFPDCRLSDGHFQFLPEYRDGK